MIRRFLNRRRALPTPNGAEPQAGAIPYVVQDGVVTFLVVTSRRTGRWVFPKGGLMTGLTAAQSAAQEALEEAGVEGEVAAEAIGGYSDKKLRAGRFLDTSVAMFPLRVTRQLDAWKEMRQRRRHWATLPELRRLLTTPGLYDLAQATAAHALASAAGDPDQPDIEKTGQ